MIVIYLVLYLMVGLCTARACQEYLPEQYSNDDQLMGLICLFWPFAWSYGLFCLAGFILQDVCRGLGRLVRWGAGGKF